MTGGVTLAINGFFSYIKKHWFLYMLVLPGLLCLLIFSYGPMYGLLLAFKDLNYKTGILGSPWVGFKHFETFLKDPYFYKVLKNTVIINVYNLLFGFTFIIFLALMINELRSKITKKIVQTFVYLPYFLSWVIFAGLIMTFLSPQDGLVNSVIRALGGETVDFLTEPRLFRAMLVVTNTIKTAGYSTIIYLAAIAGINPELYESTTVDGGNRYHMIRYITLPRIYPSIAVMLILQLAGLFQSNFDQVFNLYTPMVYETGDVISTYIYRLGLVNNQFEQSTAINLLFNLLGLIIIIYTNKFIKKMDVMGIF